MNSTQNERINQITSSTLIVGVDIAKFKHVARAQDYRGVGLDKPITFENNREGFELFVGWFWKIATKQRVPGRHSLHGTDRPLLAEPGPLSKRTACCMRCG